MTEAQSRAANAMGVEDLRPFLQALESVPTPLSNVYHVESSDGISLAVTEQQTKGCERSANVLLIGGTHLFRLTAQQFVEGVKSDEPPVGYGVYAMDMRGTGLSAGRRLDAPTRYLVWGDIATVVSHIRQDYPNLPLFVAGFGEGCALLVNYVASGSHIVRRIERAKARERNNVVCVCVCVCERTV